MKFKSRSTILPPRYSTMQASIPMDEPRFFKTEAVQESTKRAVMWDVISVVEGQKLRVRFDSCHSECRQGIWLKTDRGLVVYRVPCPSVDLWVDAAPREVVVECHTTDGRLHVYNLWERGPGHGPKSVTSCMLIERLSDGARRYHCNNLGGDTAFDKLVFTIEPLPR